MQTRKLNFKATDPYKKMKSWFSFFNFASTLSSGLIGKLILPAQLQEAALMNAQLAQELIQIEILLENGTVITHDQAMLDTAQLTLLALADLPMDQRTFIVKFNGNGTHYENVLDWYAQDAKRLNSTIVAFNYRGVGHSVKSPNSFNDLVIDGIAQVQRLLANGAKPNSILLDGHSLGGAVATMVAKHFHDQSIKVRLWNDRSFQSISKAAAGMLTSNNDDVLSQIKFTASASTFWTTLASTNWEEKVAAAYNSIPTDDKGYLVVAKKSQLSSGDGVIAHAASLHKGVKDFEREHRIKTGFKVFSKEGSGHNQPRLNLISKEAPETSGQKIYEDYVLRKPRL